MLTYPQMILAALDRRDNLAILLRVAPDGLRIVQASESVSRITGLAPAALSGQPLATLAGPGDPQARAPGWAALFQAAASGAALDGEIELRSAAGQDVLFGFGLTHVDNGDGGTTPVLIGRDITASRRQLEQTRTQALLASVFLKTGAAVAVIRADGVVMTANPAFARLVGYTMDELRQVHVRVLTSPLDIARAGERHRHQLATGEPYEMSLGIVRKSGEQVQVHLSSEMLEVARNERYRVVTLQPRQDGAAAPLDQNGAAAPLDQHGAAAPPDQHGAAAPVRHQASVGHVRMLSLAALREAFGAEWDRVAERAMMIAEQVLKRHLGERDVFARTAGQGFAIWYAEGEAEDNAARTATIARHIRILLLSEFDERAGPVTALTAELDITDQAGAPNPALLDSLAARVAASAEAIVAQARETLAAIAAAPARQDWWLTDRAARAVPMTLIDLPAALAARFTSAASALPEEEPAALDLLRLGLALDRLAIALAQGGQHSVLVPLGCDTLMLRRGRESYMQALAARPAGLRARLLPVVVDIGAQTSPTRLVEAMRLLRPLVRDIGVQLADSTPLPAPLAAFRPAMLVLEDPGGRLADPALHDLIRSAVQQRIHVLARLSDPARRHAWRDIGATLFATPQPPT